MRSPLLASAALILGLFAFGCSASAPTQNSAESSNDLVAPTSCETVQHLPYASHAQIADAIASFRAQNPGTWKIDSLTGVDGMQAAIRDARRTDLPAAASLPANAEAIARAFMHKNSGLLHFTAEGMASTDFHVAAGGGPSAVSLTYSGIRAGTEAFGQSIFDIIHLTLWLADDGSVVKMQSWSSTNPDQITLCAQPPGAPVIDSIIGTDLVVTPLEFVPVTPPTPVGKVEASDVGAAEPTIFALALETEEQLIIAFRIAVNRGGHTWYFTADAVTGKVLQVEQWF